MTPIDQLGYYAAFKAKDTRFDGRFFVGVRSTGIYCRPVCRAKLPKPENCTFLSNAATAEQAGFRPCLLCRSELAPGTAPVDAAHTLAIRAARLLEAGCTRQQGITDIAQRLGCTDRHLRRQTLDGSERNTDVTIGLGYRPPYHWRQMLDFLALRAIPGVEMVKDGEYGRTVHLVTEDKQCVQGWIRMGNQPKKNPLSVTMDANLLPVLPQVLSRVRHLLDLHCNPDIIYETLTSMNEIRPGHCVLGTRLPGCFDAFEMAVRAVLGQQITVKGARALATRLTAHYGIPIETGIEGLTHAFPTAERILALGERIKDRLGALGFTGARGADMPRSIYGTA